LPPRKEAIGARDHGANLGIAFGGRERFDAGRIHVGMQRVARAGIGQREDERRFALGRPRSQQFGTHASVSPSNGAAAVSRASRVRTGGCRSGCNVVVAGGKLL
jgi:hypothetical protein